MGNGNALNVDGEVLTGSGGGGGGALKGDEDGLKGDRKWRQYVMRH